MSKSVPHIGRATKRLRLQAYPVFEDMSDVVDFLARAAWHFSHVPEIDLYVPLSISLGKEPKNIKIPEGFSSEVQRSLDSYLGRVRFQVRQIPKSSTKLLDLADVVLKWKEGDSETDKAVSHAKKTTFRVDPLKVRQEGSFFIQCAFDLYSQKENDIAECQRKFEHLYEHLGRKKNAWVMATGPSVEGYKEHNFDDSTVIVCNSVVLNDDLMSHCKPAILVFADPIFHFGVSQYAGAFREAVAHRLATTDIRIIVPFKYYPLLISKFPEYTNRIIGVPFEKTLQFNFDLTKLFQVKTTANILTLLLLPIATTFAKEVNVIGCDGRPLEQDDYFWGHGKSVQINDKMENIQRVHPGFFAIDYNEYYFEHCHTLSNLIAQAEAEGFKFYHHGKSHIPSFRDRQYGKKSPLNLSRTAREGECLVLEPDGLGLDGHYVKWHRNLVQVLQGKFRGVSLLCNKRQDPQLYPCPAYPTFTSFSWGISRSDMAFKRDFTEHASFKRFVDELYEGISLAYQVRPKILSLYIYYGSVQVLKAIQVVRRRLLKEGCDLKAFVCLFHESVILDVNQAALRFPPNAKDILLEAAAQVDSYRIASVTKRLSDFIFEKFEVKTEVFTNPVPALSDGQSVDALLMEKMPHKKKVGGRSVVLFPTNPRDEKGAAVISEFIDYLSEEGVPKEYKYVFRGVAPANLPKIEGIQFLGDKISDDEYWLNMKQADVVVIPYLAPCFTYRTSGILVDALVSEVPCVVMAETWLADVVREVGAGLTINYRGPLTLASAIKVLLSNKEMMSRRLSTGKEKYIGSNSWEKTASFAIG